MQDAVDQYFVLSEAYASKLPYNGVIFKVSARRHGWWLWKLSLYSEIILTYNKGCIEVVKDRGRYTRAPREDYAVQILEKYVQLTACAVELTAAEVQKLEDSL